MECGGVGWVEETPRYCGTADDDPDCELGTNINRKGGEPRTIVRCSKYWMRPRARHGYARNSVDGPPLENTAVLNPMAPDPQARPYIVGNTYPLIDNHRS